MVDDPESDRSASGTYVSPSDEEVPESRWQINFAWVTELSARQLVMGVELGVVQTMGRSSI
jgi:hypothetical protein